MSKYKYPIRMISILSGRVVEFTGLTTGTTISNRTDGNYEDQEIGYLSGDWFEHTNTDKWKPYNPIWLNQNK